MGTVVFRTSSTTAGGTANATSLGGRPSATAPSTTKHLFFDTVTQAQADAGTTDYRCLFVYNSGTTDLLGVRVQVTNKANGATVTVARSSVTAASFASYVTTTIANETTAPSIAGVYGSSVDIGDLGIGQVRAVWLKRVAIGGIAVTSDNVKIDAFGSEVV